MKATSRRSAIVLIAAAAVVIGILVIHAGLSRQLSAPPVHVAGRLDTAPPSETSPNPLGPSRPVRLRIPALGIDTRVNPIGLASNGALAVPQPGPHLNQAAWFKDSPTPGQPGVSIVEGHVDSVEGISVFWRLGEIKPGEHVTVFRQDGSRLLFTVKAVRNYRKDHFPTMSVYGGDLGRPSLRLITCSDFIPAIHHHVGDEVVYTELTRVVHARRSKPQG